jgi:hypothetical protein
VSGIAVGSNQYAVLVKLVMPVLILHHNELIPGVDPNFVEGNVRERHAAVAVYCSEEEAAPVGSQTEANVFVAGGEHDFAILGDHRQTAKQNRLLADSSAVEPPTDIAFAPSGERMKDESPSPSTCAT